MEQLKRFPDTRYMGSKQRIAHEISSVIDELNPKTALDAFSGSGVVSYLLKSKGIHTHSNDFLLFSHLHSKALVENSSVKLSRKEVQQLVEEPIQSPGFVTKTFDGLFFSDDDNREIDQIRFNIEQLKGHKKAIALAALNRACIKKRGRGIFTYTGLRYDDGRKDLQLSIREQFELAVQAINAAVFSNGKKNKAFNYDIFEYPSTDYDLVYIDPPYYSLHSDNDYSRRYHFVEGLSSLWTHVNINHNTKTKKFNNKKSPFDKKSEVYEAFHELFKKFQGSDLVISYSSNSLPTLHEMVEILERYKERIKVIEIDHKYSFGTQRKSIERNSVKEYLFVAQGKA